jgi:RND family efflux transporter MFP subunit
VLGYGTARPGDVWSAVADVRGRIVETHSELKAGAILRKGEVVLRIDPSEYELRVAQLEAEIAQVAAQQQELEAQKTNFQQALAIEEDSLRLAERDQERMRGLRSSSAVTESEYDKSTRDVLAQRQSVQSLTNSLNVLPSQQQALAASLRAKQASLGQAQLDLEHTVMRAPFDCRLSEVSLEEGQFVTAGQSLFQAYGADVTEVEAQLPIDQVRNLLDAESGPMDLSNDAMNVVRSVFNVDAIVRLRTGDFLVEWDARFDRIREELDLQTRTLRVVVSVDKPYENVVPGKRPPLSPGMFCEVELRGQPRINQVVVPRGSVREDHIYLVNDENRLERRAVDVAFSQGGFSVISAGLDGGERIVVSDPTPAVEGMLVTPTNDPGVAERLLADATGESPVR